MWRPKKWFFRGDCNYFFISKMGSICWLLTVRCTWIRLPHLKNRSEVKLWDPRKKSFSGAAVTWFYFFSIFLSILSKNICMEYFVSISDEKHNLVTLESQKKVPKNQKSWKWPKMAKNRSAYNFFLKIYFLFFVI